MDSEAISSATTAVSADAGLPGLPVRMDTVVVFGDSLSDIGKKWKTNSGEFAIMAGEMYVSPTGRYSDCRNWTDFMFEAASGGTTLVADTAEETIAQSKLFGSFSKTSRFQESFQYANYAEGGACGDTPATKKAFLGTMHEQVDAFIKDCKVSQLPLGNTLFIIWFGANDLYTAERTAEGMSCVAQQIAGTQRKRLAEWVKAWNNALLKAEGQCKFIFVDLCRPLTSVRYKKRLEDAERKMRYAMGLKYVGGARPKLGGVVQPTMFDATDTLQQALKAGFKTGKSWGFRTDAEVLRAQIEATKNLEQGVRLFNATLKKTANENGDRVAEVGNCISEDTLNQLVQTHKYKLKSGALGAAVSAHYPARRYNSSDAVRYTTTIDQVHPTDRMYKLIWLEIREEIRRSRCTFGSLDPAPATSPLAEIAFNPSPRTRLGYDAVMQELLTRHGGRSQ